MLLSSYKNVKKDFISAIFTIFAGIYLILSIMLVDTIYHHLFIFLSGIFWILSGVVIIL